MSAPRLLIVTEAGEAWPSAYVRAGIYADLLRSRGIETVFTSRRSPSLTARLEAPREGSMRALAPLVRRLGPRLQRLDAARRTRRILAMSSGFDVVYLQKVASADLVLQMRRRTRARLVYDLNDGVWLPSRAGFADGRIAEILAAVDAVTCDNPHTLSVALRTNRSSALVPDPSQVEAFAPFRTARSKPASPIVIGWVGSRGTAFNLYLIWEALERVFARHPGLELRILGADAAALPAFERLRPSLLPVYSRTQMMEEISRMHIGLFPLYDIEDSLARGFLKAEISMSGGAAVIASPIGQCRDEIQDGRNGLLAASPREWEEKLESLIRDAELRARIAREGLRTVQERFSLERCFAALLEALGLGARAGAAASVAGPAVSTRT